VSYLVIYPWFKLFSWMSSKDSLHPVQQMISSSAGALFVSLFTTPFDVVKVRLQAQLKPDRLKCTVFNEVVETVCYCTHPPVYNSPVVCAIYGNIRTVPRFSSTKDAFFKIAKVEGIGKLWRGLSPTLIQMVPQTVVYFTAYDQLKVKFGYNPGEQNIIPPLIAGVCARVFAVMAVSPMEMVRTKLQSKKGLQYRKLLYIVINSIKEEGIFSLWRGIGPTILRDVPFSAFYWVSYETLKAVHPDPDIATNFCAGALSGMFAAFLTTPFDVVKTFRQIELGEKKQKMYYDSRLPFTFRTITHLYKTQGITSLYTGLIPRLAKVAPACAIMISTYEYGKKYFAERNKMDM